MSTFATQTIADFADGRMVTCVDDASVEIVFVCPVCPVKSTKFTVRLSSNGVIIQSLSEGRDRAFAVNFDDFVNKTVQKCLAKEEALLTELLILRNLQCV